MTIKKNIVVSLTIDGQVTSDELVNFTNELQTASTDSGVALGAAFVNFDAANRVISVEF